MATQAGEDAKEYWPKAPGQVVDYWLNPRLNTEKQCAQKPSITTTQFWQEGYPSFCMTQNRGQKG